jgi:methylisocitrate lyase
MKASSKAGRLRKLIKSGCVAMPGAFNAATARLIEKAGFDAVYVSGAGLANATAGVPDIGLLGLAEFAQLAGYAARAVKIPTLADADTGFGGAANAAAAVQAYERAGLAGMHLEDQVFPKRCGHLEGKAVISVQEMTEKIRAAVKARRDPDFLIIARTDARAVEGFAETVERAKAYLAAGADAIFPEALETAREFRDFARKISAPLMANMTEFGRSPLLTVQQLATAGYRMVIFPQTAFRVSMHTMEKCLRDLRWRGSQRTWLDKMQTRAELYELLGYDPKSGEFSGGG